MQMCVSLLSVCVCKLGHWKPLGAANGLINWLWWRLTYIMLRVSVSVQREMDVSLLLQQLCAPQGRTLST